MTTQSKQFVLTKKEDSIIIGMILSVVNQVLSALEMHVHAVRTVDNTVYYTVHHAQATFTYEFTGTKQDGEYLVVYTFYTDDTPQRSRTTRIATVTALHAFILQVLSQDI